MLIVLILAAIAGQSYQFIDGDTGAVLVTKADSFLKVKSEQVQLQTETESYQREEIPINPNTVRFNQLVDMGFSKKDAAMFLAYRKKNPKFEQSDDVMKIFYIDQEKLSTLLAASDWEIPATKVKPTFNQSKPESKEIKPKAVLMVELNTADSLTLIKLPTIGGFRAMKIMQHRKRLGGFVHLEQLKEIKYFDDSLINTIKPFVSIDSSIIKKININADDSLMNKHPYFWNGIAKNLINYRKQNGAFKSINDLKKLYTLNEEKINKIKPYIKFQ